MRKQPWVVLTLSLLIMNIAPVSADTGSDMEILAAGLKVVQKSDDATYIKATLMKMRAAARSAQKQMPPKLENKARNSDELKDYSQAYDRLIGQIDVALKLADEGKVKEAQAAAEKLKPIRDAYHKKYR